MDLSVVPYTETRRVETAAPAAPADRYRECMRNHAAAIGGQAYDGCGEFMPGGEDGSIEALKCAACGCHRNFHRRDGAELQIPRRPLLLSPPPGYPAFLAPPVTAPYHQIRPPPPPPAAFRAGSETPPRRGEEERSARKRQRTRFTAAQKEKMQAFAERLGWRIQKHDDAALDEFCVEVGVKRHVLKVWMHNNKSVLSSSPTPSPTPVSNAASNRDAAAAAAASAPAIRV